MVRLSYVILHHTGVADPHFDIMIERAPGEPLRTWRSPRWPITEPTALEELPDHRQAYLTYQGPVSQNRGQVRRAAGGTCAVESPNDNQIILRLDDGPSVSIDFTIENNWLASPTK
jgi:hypothetical protein